MANYVSSFTGTQIDDSVGVTEGAGTGIVVKTGTSAGVKRSVDGTTNQITVTNGDGVAGNPTLALASAVTTSLGKADTAVQPADISDVVRDADITDVVRDADITDVVRTADITDVVRDADITDVVRSNTAGITGADAITNVVSLTQAEYDAIATPNASTLYVIV